MIPRTPNESQNNSEQLASSLRALYRSCGYTPYRMSKFEEYELYAQNKDFLRGGGILTFTDTDGKLMALKPDVTLSIIKNLRRQSGVQKVFYNENVYRVSHNSGTYRELLQTGLECIGDIGEYELTEVLYLALKTLEATGKPYRLDLSHMGLVSSLLSQVTLTEDDRTELLACVRRKNADGIRELLKEAGASPSVTDALAEAATLYGSPETVLPQLCRLLGEDDPAIRLLTSLCDALRANGFGDKLAIDPSIVNDMSYYSSLVFRGYVDGVPDGVLSGGSYDALMKKMGRDCSALGFALSHDSLELLYRTDRGNDVDLLLVYDTSLPPEAVLRCRNALSSEGLCVLALPKCPEGIRAAVIKYLRKDGTVSDTE